MTDTSKHKKENRDDFFDQFSAAEREEMKEVWDLHEPVDGVLSQITDDEIEKALDVVHLRLNFPDENSSTEKSDKTFFRNLLMAAALVLIAFGSGLWLIPKSVTAPYGEIATVNLPDGTMVELNSGSRISYGRLLLNRDVSLDGEAYFAVKDGERPFSVRANGSVIEVTGTEFNIRSWSDDPLKSTEVTVFEGEVLFYPESFADRQVTLRPGLISSWNPQMDEPETPAQISTDRIPGWRNNLLMLSNKPLISIFRELERTYDVRIRMDAQDIAFETLTVHYAEKRDIESVLNDICTAKGLRYSRTRDGFRVYK